MLVIPAPAPGRRGWAHRRRDRHTCGKRRTPTGRAGAGTACAVCWSRRSPAPTLRYDYSGCDSGDFSHWFPAEPVLEQARLPAGAGHLRRLLAVRPVQPGLVVKRQPARL